jgi:antitoxin (DNA-binding transcriptional repressor) of toxin-antitoxin stability system
MKSPTKTTATVLETKTHLSKLLRKVKNGEVVTITSGREKKPIAFISSTPPQIPKPKLSPIGALDHLNIRIPDSFFFDPLPKGWDGLDD